MSHNKEKLFSQNLTIQKEVPNCSFSSVRSLSSSVGGTYYDILMSYSIMNAGIQ